MCCRVFNKTFVGIFLLRINVNYLNILFNPSIVLELNDKPANGANCDGEKQTDPSVAQRTRKYQKHRLNDKK